MHPKPYLKLYLIILGAFLGVALVCFGLYQGLNSVRERAYLEALPAPLMSWVAAHPEFIGATTSPDLSGAWDFGIDARSELGAVELERLGYGQVIVDQDAGGLRWYMQLQDGSLLQLALDDPYRDLGEMSARLIARLFELQPGTSHGAGFADVGAALGVLVEPVVRQDQLPDQDVLDQLGDGHIGYDQPSASDPAQLFFRVHGEGLRSGQLMRVTLPPPFDPWAWPLLLLMFSILAAAVSGLVYLLLSRLHHRLASIENVVARIARGELDARVREGNQPVVDRLGYAFNSMAEHIQRLVGVQREMIHAVSHELRTPVARIRFGVQMLDDGGSDPEREKQLAAIDGDIQELDELIDEILTYARLEQGGPVLTLEEVNVSKIVRQVVSEQQSTHPKITISAPGVREQEDAALSDADPRYLHRAIQNLVGNATRYARSEVRVICHFEPETCRVDVEDDGTGVPEEYWDKVFTAFARLDDSRTRKSGGYGLGLSIVRRILFWHGGQAFVGRSEELGGARFSLVWPRRQPDLEAGERS
ncbi:ATP-binding protein [Hydrocarboniclastica marina]|uniref:histidine kinase n=1 Tax=Hydrocarboniclastica marina TaxID=2259620 RepID=A0A4P7XED8_9ALTE|nr:ATP-binding protein [Hydrocarboniclastica marina]QCF25261.1 HAMP domain-containing protein [Hydrocarboniclastica marina]